MNFRTLAVAAAAATLALSLTACGGGNHAEESTAADALNINTQQHNLNISDIMRDGRQQTQETNGVMVLNTVMAGGFNQGLTPAAVRQHYRLNNFTSAAQQGSGQIIAIVGAYGNPHAAEDLNRFSAMHGLPQCRVIETQVVQPARQRAQVTNIPTARLGDDCEFQVINLDSFGNVVTQWSANGQVSHGVHSPDRRWAAETSMDIQWAHAMAPRAKIVLVNAPTNFFGAMSHAVRYASNFANVVSMSWGQFETFFETACSAEDLRNDPTCTPNKKALQLLTRPAGQGSSGGYDTIAFSNPNVTYVAASGDWGAKPMWPASSNRVLAVGGTRITGTSETGWSGSGGGTSRLYNAQPWQQALGQRRVVPDVSMVASKESPVQFYLTPGRLHRDSRCDNPSTAGSCGWYMGFGTSVSAPMMAGLVAITNAMRAEQRRAPLHFTAGLYAAASVPSQYAAAFNDITVGNNGLAAGNGFDMVTGLGTPKADALLNILTAY